MSFQPRVPPAARWAAATRPWAKSVRPRGSKLVGGSSASCGCWRADPDVLPTGAHGDGGAGAHGESVPAVPAR
ncbi:MAG: hypothetical protein ACLQU1_06305 [Bryobacteraceae bacterium]